MFVIGTSGQIFIAVLVGMAFTYRYGMARLNRNK